MSEAAPDPYAVLGVAHDVSDIELRRVYRDQVKRHHPDHNGGSAESAARFAQIQTAYAWIAQERRMPHAQSDRPVRPAQSDAGVEDRIASLEHEMAALRETEERRRQEQARVAREQQVRLARERARQAAEDVSSGGSGPRQPASPRPTPEELGYYTTEDSFTKIIDDAADQLTQRLGKSDAKRQFARRLADLFGHDD